MLRVSSIPDVLSTDECSQHDAGGQRKRIIGKKHVSESRICGLLAPISISSYLKDLS